MPNRPKRAGRTPANPGRSSISISAIPEGAGAGDADINPAFQNAGQVSPDYSGMPEESPEYQKPFIERQGFLQKWKGQLSPGQKANLDYLTKMQEAKGLTALERTNAPQVDPSYLKSPLTQSSSQGTSPLSNEAYSNLPYSMQGDKQLGGDNSLRLPFSQGKSASIGSLKGNAEILTHRAQQLADAEAAGIKERNMLEARGGRLGITEPQLMQEEAVASKGYNPSFAPSYGNLLGASFPGEQNLKDLNTGQATREANIVAGISPEVFNKPFTQSVLSGLDKQGIINAHLKRLDIPENATVIDENGVIHHGRQVMNIPEMMPMNAKHPEQGSITTGKSFQRVTPYFSERPLTNFDTSAPKNRDAVTPPNSTNNVPSISPFSQKLWGPRQNTLDVPNNQLQNGPFSQPQQDNSNPMIYQYLLKKLFGGGDTNQF